MSRTPWGWALVGGAATFGASAAAEVKVRRLLGHLFGRPDPMATMPKVRPVATRDDDGTITFTAIVPRLDPRSLKIERKGRALHRARGQLGAAALVAVARPRRCFRSGPA